MIHHTPTRHITLYNTTQLYRKKPLELQKVHPDNLKTYKDIHRIINLNLDLMMNNRYRWKRQ